MECNVRLSQRLARCAIDGPFFLEYLFHERLLCKAVALWCANDICASKVIPEFVLGVIQRVAEITLAVSIKFSRSITRLNATVGVSASL